MPARYMNLRTSLWTSGLTKLQEQLVFKEKKDNINVTVMRVSLECSRVVSDAIEYIGRF